jgi:plasmid stabilization system protein ParE
VNVRFTPEAEADLLVAKAWYSNEQVSLSNEFMRAVDARVLTISRLPNAYPLALDPIRRALLPRFPYCLYYVLRHHEVVVLACMHTARDPVAWTIRAAP